METEHTLTLQITSNTDSNGDLVFYEPMLSIGKKPNKEWFSVGEILDTDGNINGLLPQKLIERLESERQEKRRQEKNYHNEGIIS